MCLESKRKACANSPVFTGSLKKRVRPICTFGFKRVYPLSFKLGLKYKAKIKRII